MEWNGISRRSQNHEEANSAKENKNEELTCNFKPLSARGEPQSHPLAGRAQACGRLPGWKGWRARWHLSWPLTVTTAQKTTRLHTLLDRSYHPCDGPCACHPCAGAVLISVSFKQQGEKTHHTSRIVLIILAPSHASLFCILLVKRYCVCGVGGQYCSV